MLALETFLYKFNILIARLSEYFTCLLFIRRTSSNQDEKSMMADTCNTQAHELASRFRGQSRGSRVVWKKTRENELSKIKANLFTLKRQNTLVRGNTKKISNGTAYFHCLLKIIFCLFCFVGLTTEDEF